MQILKQSTAATVLVGPVLDSAGLAITTAVVGDFQLTKNGTTAALANPATATHSHNGNYLIALSTGNTDTAGRLVVTVNNSAQAMGTHRYTVLVESVFDAIITNATNTTGGLPTATGAISALAGAVSTLTAPQVRTELASELGRIDVATSSRMASYAQPTGFLAATFPGTVASPTNITAATGIVLAGVTHTGAVIPTVSDVATKTGYTATVSDKTGFSLLAGTGLGNQTANITGNLSGSVGSVTGAVGSVTAGVNVSDKTGFKLANDGLAQVTSWAVAITGNITGNLSGSVGSISSVTFPANFAGLGINSSGHISRVVLVDTTTTNTDMRGTDGAALASQWTSTRASYLDGVLIASNNNQRTVQVTGSNHVAADIHAVQAGVITSAAFTANWLTATGLAADAATEIANAVAGTQALSRLDSMIESDGAGQFRYDTIALSMAPAGGGGGGTDWTANERTAIRSILGVPTSGTTPTDPTSGILDEIRDKTALITSGGTVYVSSPVTASGQLTSPLIIGDDYLAANGRRFRWTVALPTGYVIATSTARFGMRYEDDEGVNSFVATGTVTDATGGNVYLDFDVARTITGTLRPGWYEWSVEIANASGVEITRVKSGKNVEWQGKQT